MKLSCAFLLWPILAVTAWGHGAIWRPPWLPGTGAGSPTTGAPGTGSTVSGAATATYDSWEIWWAFNREPYLPRHHSGDSQQTGVTFLTGRGVDPGGTANAALASLRRSSILPALAAALREEDTDVADSAALALARCAEGEDARPMRPLLVRALRHRSRAVQDSALLALGVLGDPDAAEVLLALLRDDPAGRAAVGTTSDVEDYRRGLAALALGFLDRPEALPELGRIARAPDSSRELASACVLSLGRHASNAQAAGAQLVGLWNERGLDREVRAQIPIALQRLPRSVGRAMLGRLVSTLRDPDTLVSSRSSIAIALGNLADLSDQEAVDALLAAASGDVDPSVRHFATLSLGRIAEGATLDRNASPEARAAEQRFFERTLDALFERLRKKGKRSDRPFAALALGLLLRSEAVDAVELPRFGSVRGLVGRKLLDALEEEKDPSHRGALAIALGLGGAQEAREPLADLLERTKHPVLQGHLAIAVALLGDRTTIPTLRAILTEKGTPQSLLVETARALGMLGDAEFQGQLVAMIQEAGNLSEAAAAATGLGLMAGADSVPPLLEILGNSREQELRRAFSAVALGLLAEKHALPWNVVYAVDANYTLPNQALGEALTIL